MTDSTECSFEAAVQQQGAVTFLRLPFDPDKAWGKKDRHHITGMVNGTKIRGPLIDRGGPALRLPSGWLADTPIAPGELVHVVLRPEGPQIEALDPDVSEALAGNPTAKAFFESLATFYRKGYLTWLAGAARRPEVRKLRVAEFVACLEQGKKERPR